MKWGSNTWVGGSLVAIAIGVAVFAPWIALTDPVMDANLMNAELPPSLGVPVRHRRAGPRHLFPHLLRRAHLAHRRRGQPDLQQPDRRHLGPHRRLLGRLVGRLRERPHQPHARHPLAGLRARHHGDPGPRPGEPGDRARAHELVLFLPHRPRPGPVAEEPGLRPGRAHPGLWRPAHHVHPGPAQHPGAADRDRHPGHGRRHPGRGGAVLPGARHPAALPELGQHAVGGARPDPRGAVAVGVPRPRHLLHRARPQPFGRRPARHPRSAVADEAAHERAAAPGRRPAHHPSGRRRVVQRRRERLLRDRPRRGLRAGGRIGLRQEHHRARRHGPAAPAAVAGQGPHRARRRGDPGRLGRPPARAARQPHRHDLPGADDGAQSRCRRSAARSPRCSCCTRTPRGTRRWTAPRTRCARCACPRPSGA